MEEQTKVSWDNVTGGVRGAIREGLPKKIHSRRICLFRVPEKTVCPVWGARRIPCGWRDKWLKRACKGGSGAKTNQMVGLWTLTMDTWKPLEGC